MFEMKNGLSRRQFLRQASLAVGTAALAGPSLVRGQNLNSKINVACIGVGGKGDSDSSSAYGHGCNIVALCDVDQNTLQGKLKQLTDRAAKDNRDIPAPKVFKDFRKLFDEMEKSIDAVTVSTPDHCHGVATTMALRRGKHVYTQKPLVQTVEEARAVGALVKEKKVATQMGNQGSAETGLRRAVEVIQAGVIGKPLELHVWSNRPIWPQGIDRPEGEDPVPATLDWDLWLGPAKLRPYKRGVYHPFAWRGWYDYGTGALGDMACHTVNMPFRALKLGYPTAIECEEVSDSHAETYPKSSRIRFEFPEREGLPPLKFWWYDGNPGDRSFKPFRPKQEVVKEIVEMRGGLPGSGCLVVGEKGKLFSPDDYGSNFYMLVGDEKEYTEGKSHAAAKPVPQTIPRSPGHDAEWFKAIRDGNPNFPYSNFNIAAYLTEIILLGCVALRHGVNKKIEWDGPAAKAKNADVTALTHRQYRQGYSLNM